MRLYLDLQIATEFNPIPTKATISRWIKTALLTAGRTTDTEITLRLVDKKEITALNQTFRYKNYATNVLSFPFELPEGIDDLPLIGDMIICLDVVAEEAKAQNKTVYHHLTHMVVHGCLHLLGFDHEDTNEALEMENLERLILKDLKIADPYLE